MKIMETVKKVPGGLMIIPLLLGCLVNTFFPQVFAYFDGTFTYSLWKGGSMSLLAAFLFCNGTTINFKEAGVTVYKGVVLTAAKVLSGMACGLLVGMIFGENGIFGIAPIAIIACFSNSNGGIYAALAGEYGDGTDVGAVSILALNDGPFFTMLALGAAGYSVPVNTLAGCVVPILAGVILGNLDPEIRKFCEPGATMLIPFFAFPLGANLTLSSFAKAGIPGIMLGVCGTLITGMTGFLVYAWRCGQFHSWQRGSYSCSACGSRGDQYAGQRCGYGTDFRGDHCDSNSLPNDGNFPVWINNKKRKRGSVRKRPFTSYMIGKGSFCDRTKLTDKTKFYNISGTGR